MRTDTGLAWFPGWKILLLSRALPLAGQSLTRQQAAFSGKPNDDRAEYRKSQRSPRDERLRRNLHGKHEDFQ